MKYKKRITKVDKFKQYLITSKLTPFWQYALFDIIRFTDVLTVTDEDGLEFIEICLTRLKTKYVVEKDEGFKESRKIINLAHKEVNKLQIELVEEEMTA